MPQDFAGWSADAVLAYRFILNMWDRHGGLTFSQIDACCVAVGDGEVTLHHTSDTQLLHWTARDWRSLVFRARIELQTEGPARHRSAVELETEYRRSTPNSSALIHRLRDHAFRDLTFSDISMYWHSRLGPRSAVPGGRHKIIRSSNRSFEIHLCAPSDSTAEQILRDPTRSLLRLVGNDAVERILDRKSVV